MSKFSDSVDFMTAYHQERLDGELNNVRARKWSTTPYTSYEEMLKTFDSSEENELIVKDYAEAKRSNTANDRAGTQTGSRLRLHFILGIRRAIRCKFIGSGLSPRSGQEPARHDNWAKRLIIISLNRLKDWLLRRGGPTS